MRVVSDSSEDEPPAPKEGPPKIKLKLTAAAPPPAEPHVISLKLTNRKRQASEAGLEELDAPPTIRLRQPADLSAPTDGLFSDDAEDQEEEDYEEEAPAKRLTKKQGGAASKRSRAGSKTKGAVTSPPVVNKMAQIIAERQAKAKAQKEEEEEEDTAAMTASERLKNASRSIIGVRAKDIFSMTSSPSTSRPVSRLPPKKSTPIAKGHRPPMTPSTTQKDEPVPKKPDLPTSQSDIIAMYAQKKREKEEREREAEVARQNQRQMEARLAETKKRQQAQALEQARLEEEKRQRLLFLEEERQRKAQSFATEEKDVARLNLRGPIYDTNVFSTKVADRLLALLKQHRPKHQPDFLQRVTHHLTVAKQGLKALVEE